MIMKTSILIIALVAITISMVNARKVTIGAYYESICPGCRESFLTNIDKARRYIDEYIDIDLVPFGNAHIYGNTVQCQHGQSECFGNALHACALNQLGFEQAYKYIKCMFSSSSWTQPSYSGQQCAQQLGLNYNSLKSCADGSQGFQLIQRMASKTPSHNYVPWDTVEGVHVEEDLTSYICQRYLGNDVPGCQRYFNDLSVQKKEKSIIEKCYN